MNTFKYGSEFYISILYDLNNFKNPYVIHFKLFKIELIKTIIKEFYDQTLKFKIENLSKFTGTVRYLRGTKNTVSKYLGCVR